MKNKTVLLLLISLSYFTVKARVIPTAGQANKPQTDKPVKKRFITQSVNTFKIDSGSIDIPMVFVQGGSFIMGDGQSYNSPKHQVTLSGFYIGRHDVTQAEWKAIMGNNPSDHKNCDDCPVENVSWDDAQEFIGKLNAKTGKTYRLPTEAEWEYAAKGGKKSNDYIFGGSNDIDKVAWYDANYKNMVNQTHPVGQKKPNELGLYDMTGNVNQWCQDWFDENYYDNCPTENPPGPATGSIRVFRGGSWSFARWYCRVAFRISSSPGFRNNDLGFRLVLVP